MDVLFDSPKKNQKPTPSLIFIGYRRQDRRREGRGKSREAEEYSTFDTFGKRFVKALLVLWWICMIVRFGYIYGEKRKINNINNQKHYKSWKEQNLQSIEMCRAM